MSKVGKEILTKIKEVEAPSVSDFAELKKGGYIMQNQENLFTIRLRIPVGKLLAEQLEAVARVSKKYGTGEIHITTRQGLQITNVPYEHLIAITKELNNVGLSPGSCGPRMRNIVACTGYPNCRNSIQNSQELGLKIDQKFFAVGKIPTKIKIGISGCPNSCTRPYSNDFGFMGVAKVKYDREKCTGCDLCIDLCKEGAIEKDGEGVRINEMKCVKCGLCTEFCPEDAFSIEERGFKVFVGGKAGRHPKEGYLIADFVNKDQIFEIIDRGLSLFKEKGIPGERFGTFIDRLGLDQFKLEVLGNGSENNRSKR